MSLLPHCVFRRGRSPIVATAIHHGHDVNPLVDARIALDDAARLREEDPHTAEWAQSAKIQVVGLRSRFEIDLNRPRDRAVYRGPDDAWGLQVWKSPPDEVLIATALNEYDTFYREVELLLREMIGEFGRVVVYDLHSYNHRREGADAPAADEQQHPEVNVGTGSMERDFWGSVVDRFLDDLRSYDFQGRGLDVRENINFTGGYFSRWIHATFPRQVCALAIEFKKFFMNEWTGVADPLQVEEIYKALCSTIPGVEQELKQL